jgi:hypothetical protein
MFQVALALSSTTLSGALAAGAAAGAAAAVGAGAGVGMATLRDSSNPCNVPVDPGCPVKSPDQPIAPASSSAGGSVQPTPQPSLDGLANNSSLAETSADFYLEPQSSAGVLAQVSSAKEPAQVSSAGVLAQVSSAGGPFGSTPQPPSAGVPAKASSSTPTPTSSSASASGEVTITNKDPVQLNILENPEPGICNLGDQTGRLSFTLAFMEAMVNINNKSLTEPLSKNFSLSFTDNQNNVTRFDYDSFAKFREGIISPDQSFLDSQEGRKYRLQLSDKMVFEFDSFQTLQDNIGKAFEIFCNATGLTNKPTYVASTSPYNVSLQIDPTAHIAIDSSGLVSSGMGSTSASSALHQYSFFNGEIPTIEVEEFCKDGNALKFNVTQGILEQSLISAGKNSSGSFAGNISVKVGGNNKQYKSMREFIDGESDNKYPLEIKIEDQVFNFKNVSDFRGYLRYAFNELCKITGTTSFSQFVTETLGINETQTTKFLNTTPHQPKEAKESNITSGDLRNTNTGDLSIGLGAGLGIGVPVLAASAYFLYTRYNANKPQPLRVAVNAVGGLQQAGLVFTEGGNFGTDPRIDNFANNGPGGPFAVKVDGNGLGVVKLPPLPTQNRFAPLSPERQGPSANPRPLPGPATLKPSNSITP